MVATVCLAQVQELAVTVSLPDQVGPVRVQQFQWTEGYSAAAWVDHAIHGQGSGVKIWRVSAALHLPSCQGWHLPGKLW